MNRTSLSNNMDLCFDDVLIRTRFSDVRSRKDVDTYNTFLENRYIPIINANMDSVASTAVVDRMQSFGAVGCLHRFQTIDETLNQVKGLKQFPMASLGVAPEEVERFLALRSVGVHTFVLDVAHGAHISVVEQVKRLNAYHKDFRLIVGNFDSSDSIRDFLYHLEYKKYVDAFKVGIGGGSACTTRIVTGCGRPTLASILDCRNVGYPIIADGGIRNSGDVAKAIAAGASLVMMGKVFAGSHEAPGDDVYIPSEYNSEGLGLNHIHYKRYRGSASHSSYADQGKAATHRTPEGESFLVPTTGTVTEILQQLDAGLRSSMSYVGVNNIADFQKQAQLIHVSASSVKESLPHGKQGSIS